MAILVSPAEPARLNLAAIEGQLSRCARLPSLSSIHTVLHELLEADQCYTAQIAEVIRRDPSMTTRLLRLVNSVYFGLACPISCIEEAVFYLGVRQIRQLAMVTPIIEELQKMAGPVPFSWREFWQHCIATAILTREIMDDLQPATEEIDYVSGLLHDVGKIIMAAAFGDHFKAIQHRLQASPNDLLELEREILGMDHCELGALYLQEYRLPAIVVETVRFHHRPQGASRYARIIAAVQIADLLVRHARIGDSGNPKPVSDDEWLSAPGWEIVFPQQAQEKALARANLQRSLERLPTILEGLV